MSEFPFEVQGIGEDPFRRIEVGQIVAVWPEAGRPGLGRGGSWRAWSALGEVTAVGVESFDMRTGPEGEPPMNVTFDDVRVVVLGEVPSDPPPTETGSVIWVEKVAESGDLWPVAAVLCPDGMWRVYREKPGIHPSEILKWSPVEERSEDD